ncbi:MAG TPA: hypothetical protein ENN61_04815 [Bacteroidaceae bacterium]|nr:hypothetical protein [Bacteroidaceae bacterium]
MNPDLKKNGLINALSGPLPGRKSQQKIAVDLFDPDTIKREKIKRHGFEFMSPYYALSNEKIWGAIAMILSEFLELAGQMQ